jgi:hypothetical protein
MVKDRHCTFSGALGLCEGARVQRGPSEAARCASTGDFRVFPLPAALAHPLKGGLVDPLMRASNEHVSIILPPSLLVARFWKGTHVGLRAAVERGPSEGARSGSTGPTWASFLSFIVGSPTAATFLLGFA